MALGRHALSLGLVLGAQLIRMSGLGLGVLALDVSVQPVILARAGGYIVFFFYPLMLPWHCTCFIVSAHMTCPQGLAAFSLLEPGS